MQDLGALNSPQMTLASGSGGGNFEYARISLNKAGTTVIDTGYNAVVVGRKLTLGFYGISTVFLPTDIFGLPPSGAPAPPTPMISPTPRPMMSPVPMPAPSLAPTPGSLASGPVASSPLAPSPSTGTGPTADEI
ncbi:hypothetical protein GOP47_0021988 [Adiantum capillus-veneris]|uniref:Uncharacterized protein n=1 Tax=Adiantum capillus-veneris TaxID=13818 RepID=A0A9D4U8G7_ADICA|nr:hypothetical protein GOP47_0021988 [Adiantum capillus-veneris]